MKYMLDTNICTYLIKKHPVKTLQRLQQVDASDVCISVIAVSELEYGIEKSLKRDLNRLAFAEFLAPIEILPFDELAAFHYGRVRASLESKGRTIGPYDLQIAAHAFSRNLTLVTNNVREFRRVPQLSVENWAG
jgi:tRNA(fMet)-specific endonuclease VapC